MNIKYCLQKAKDVSIRDFFSLFPMIAALVALPFYKGKYRGMWGVCERKDEARDNGFHFFRYMTHSQPEQPCIYFIDKKCADFEKVRFLGRTEKFGGIRHWIFYFSGEYLISSQSFMPNAYVCTLLERSSIFVPKQVFLQHGITKDVPEFLLADHKKVNCFIAGAKPEEEFVQSHFGYPAGTVRYTGFARFDALHDFKAVPGRILIMPTWRKWLRLKSERHADTDNELYASEYIRRWKELTNSEKFIRLIQEKKLEVFFYPHPNMKSQIDLKMLTNDYVRLADGDIQELMKTSQLMITDYSSVFFDMVYMKKPVIFYQFDEEKFREYHYAQGWFDYHQTAFGKSFSNEGDVVAEVRRIAERDYAVDEAFLSEHASTFVLYDENNSERIFKALKGIR